MNQRRLSVVYIQKKNARIFYVTLSRSHMVRFTLQQQRSRNENKLNTEKEIIFFMHQQGERKKTINLVKI
jgi:hypothetical protein